MKFKKHTPGNRAPRLAKAASIAVALFLLASALLPPLFRPAAEDPGEPAFYVGERVACMDSNADAMVWRLRLIRSARERLILSTFDLRPDETGLDILAALQEAADRGIRIQILVDGICDAMYLRGDAQFQSLCAMPNVEAKSYNPINLLKPWMLNYRMHDKYLIADDHVYLLGGRNTYDLFLREDLDRYNIDRDVLVYTPEPEKAGSLDALMAYFDEIWSLPESKDIPLRQTERAEEAREDLRLRAASLEQRYPGAADAFDWDARTYPAERVALLTNPTHPGNKQPLLWTQLCSLMAQGREIRIQTPYIICGRAMYRDLEAILSQVQSLQIMTNAPEGGANPFGCADFLNQKNRLLGMGAETLEWLGGQSLHTKTVLIDDNLSVIGSFNLDMRSVCLDTELMVVVDCPRLNAELRQGFDVMAEQSRISGSEGERLGEQCPQVRMPLGKALLYTILRVLLLPIRHLL